MYDNGEKAFEEYRIDDETYYNVSNECLKEIYNSSPSEHQTVCSQLTSQYEISFGITDSDASCKLSTMSDFQEWIKGLTSCLAPLFGASSLIVFLYANPVVFGFELSSLFISGLVADIVKLNSVNIANIFSFEENRVYQFGEFINNVRWPLVGVSAAVTSTAIIKHLLLNEVVIKTISSVLATVFTHSYMNIAPIVNKGLEKILIDNIWEKDINSIFFGGNNRSLWEDAAFFASQKFLEEEFKLLSNMRLYTDYSQNANNAINILENGFLNSIYRTFADSIAHKILLEESHAGRHVMLPLEFLIKSYLMTFYREYTYLNSIIPIFIGSIVKRLDFRGVI